MSFYNFVEGRIRGLEEASGIIKEYIVSDAVDYLLNSRINEYKKLLEQEENKIEKTKDNTMLKECCCGKILTKEEIEYSEKINKEAKTHLIYMCRDCWVNYAYHALTGE